MNEFLILLENAAGAGWLALVAIGVAAVALLIFDRPARAARKAERAAKERMAA